MPTQLIVRYEDGSEKVILDDLEKDIFECNQTEILNAVSIAVPDLEELCECSWARGSHSGARGMNRLCAGVFSPRCEHNLAGYHDWKLRWGVPGYFCANRSEKLRCEETKL